MSKRDAKKSVKWSPEPKWNYDYSSGRRHRSRSPTRSSSRSSHFKTPRSKSYDDYSGTNSSYRRGSHHRIEKEEKLTDTIVKIIDRKLEKRAAVFRSLASTSLSTYQNASSSMFRNPVDPIWPCSAWLGWGFPFMNSHSSSSCYSYKSYNSQPSLSCTFLNPQANFTHGDGNNTKSNNSLDATIEESVEKKIQTLLRKVTNDNVRSNPRDLTSQSQIVNKFLNCNKAPAAQSAVKQNSNPRDLASQTQLVNKVLNCKNTPAARSVTDLNSQEDRENSESDNLKDGDDVFFIAVVDKNELKKDVEVITISDDEEEEEKRDLNLELVSSDDDLDYYDRSWPEFDFDPVPDVKTTVRRVILK